MSNVLFLSLSGRCRITCKCSANCSIFIEFHRRVNQIILFGFNAKSIQEYIKNVHHLLYFVKIAIFMEILEKLCWSYIALWQFPYILYTKYTKHKTFRVSSYTSNCTMIWFIRIENSTNTLQFCSFVKWIETENRKQQQKTHKIWNNLLIFAVLFIPLAQDEDHQC